MKFGLRAKLISALAIGIILIMTISNAVIIRIMDNNVEENIKNDMKPIVEYTKESINSLVQLGEEVKWNTLNKISTLFNVYIAFQGQNLEEVGKKIILNDIELYKTSEENKDSKLKINTNDNLMAGTLLYPLYVNNGHVGNIIIQKDYSAMYLSNSKLLKSILITIGVLSLLLIVAMYLITKRFIKPLEELILAIKDFGKGKEVNDIKVKSKDETMILANEFNEMKNNIIKLQNNNKEFFNNATHELKTPLTAIRGYSQMLQDENFEDEFVNRAILRVEEESIKMNKLVENLLIISREEARIEEKNEVVNLNSIIKNVLKSFELRIESNNFEVYLEEADIVKIDIIKTDIETILTNLIDNSLKYSSDKKVNIRVGSYDNKDAFVISNKFVNVCEDIKDNLLEPFIKGNTNNKNISSSGLGLYICKRLCEKNRVNIQYEINGESIEFKLLI